MLQTEKNAFASMLKTVFFVYKQELDREIISFWWKILEGFDFQDVRKSFDHHVKSKEGKFMPTPSHILEYFDALNPDGRPTPDEAWAMMPWGEEGSVVMSEEMAEADRYAQPLRDRKDQVAARRAFVDAYSRIVEKNRLTGVPPKWFPSLGTDKGGKDQALAEAVRLGRMSASHASSLIPADRAAAMLRLAGKGDLAKQFDPATDERAKENRLRIREMTLALTKKPGTGDRDPWEEAE